MKRKLKDLYLEEEKLQTVISTNQLKDLNEAKL
jgi:hypothetical protein